jgi:hypothetical protein
MSTHRITLPTGVNVLTALKTGFHPARQQRRRYLQPCAGAGRCKKKAGGAMFKIWGGDYANFTRANFQDVTTPFTIIQGVIKWVSTGVI